MPQPDPLIQASNFDFVCEVEAQYTALLRGAGAHQDVDPALGGKLLYAGDLVPCGRALLVAGNIAGAASIAASGDPIAQKQAVRDGVADFLVTSLDEALRILKNEIRKHETVAVCVAAAPEVIEREMRERGVAPDLLGSNLDCRESSSAGFLEDEEAEGAGERILVGWSVAAAPARWLPKLDALAVDCFAGSVHPDAGALRRWLRLSPRYLGRLAQGFRFVHGTRETAQEFAVRVCDAVAHAGIETAVRVSLNRDEEVLLFEPPGKEPSQPAR